MKWKNLLVTALVLATISLACSPKSSPSAPGNVGENPGTTATPTASFTSTACLSCTATDTSTATPTVTSSATATDRFTPTPSPTATHTLPPTATISATPSATPTATFTSTPGCLFGTAYGYNLTGANSGSPNNWYYAQAFTVPTAGHIGTIAAYFKASGGNFMAALYSLGPSNADGTFIAKSPEVPYVAGWNNVTLDFSVPVTAGASYWTVIQSDGTDLAYDTQSSAYSYGYFVIPNMGQWTFEATPEFTIVSGYAYSFYSILCP